LYQHVPTPDDATAGAPASHEGMIGSLHAIVERIAVSSAKGSLAALWSTDSSHSRLLLEAHTVAHDVPPISETNQPGLSPRGSTSVSARSYFDCIPPGIAGASGQKNAPPFV
jgi:hypothetical protein